MPDLLDYKIESLESTVFDHVDPTRLSTIDALPQRLKKEKEANYLDVITLISNITTPMEIDYQLIADFFLTYRSFISSSSLLKLLLLRIQWCLTGINDEAHENRQNTGKLTLVRTFVVVRHWLMNYFAEDFVTSKQLRLLFILEVNLLEHRELFVQRVIASLKKTWTECCNKSWDENVSTSDFYNFEIKLGPQSTRNKRLSILALSQQNDPFTRNSMMLSTYDKNVVHKLPIPLPSSPPHKRKPNLFLNPKNSNLRLSMLSQTSPTSAYTTVPSFATSSRSPTSPITPRSPSDPLYVPLLSMLDPKTRNLIRDESRFPKNSTLTKVLPPTPVKKMDFVVPLPAPERAQPKGLRPLIEHWIKTFHLHKNDKAKLQTTPYVEKFMASVVSVAKPTTEELERIALGKFDILSARSIDELEHLVRFHNVVITRHGSLGATAQNVNDSFSFTVPDLKTSIKAVSNIDNMNVCETISNISKSVVSLQQHLESDSKSRKSYISYDSAFSHRIKSPTSPVKFEDTALRKKVANDNLREFNFQTEKPTVKQDEDQDTSRDGDDEKFEFENVEDEQDNSTLETFPTSILSESTPNHHDQTSVTEGPEHDLQMTVNNKNILNLEREITTSDQVSVADVEQKDVDEAKPEIHHTSTTEHLKDTESATETREEVNSVESTDKTFQNLQESNEVVEVLDVDNEDISQDSNDADDEDAPEVQEIDNVENSEVIPTAQISQSVRQSVESDVFHDSMEDISGSSPRKSVYSVESSRSQASDYEEIESFVSTYEDEEPEIEEMEAPEIEESGFNHSDLIAGDNEPSTPTHDDGLISSTPQASPIKALQEHVEYHDKIEAHSSNTLPPAVPPKNDSSLDLNKVPSFTRISNGSISSRTQDDNRVSYLSKRSIRTHKTSASENSIFSGPMTPNIVNISVQQDHDELEDIDETPRDRGDDEGANVTIGRDDDISFETMSLNSDDFQVPYPGVDSEAIAELAAISDESYQDDPINAALQKLEGQYKKRTERRSVTPSTPSRVSSINTMELNNQVQDLAIHTPARKRDSVMIDQRRKTKLFSLTPVQQKEIKYEESSSKILLELLLTHKITNEILQVSNSEHHVSFILNYNSKTLAEQLTLIEKDALLEIDWKELVDLTWESEKLVPINSWLELLVQNQDIQGVDLCVSRFNLTVNWIISEILLTKDKHLRKLTIQRFIHVAQNCKTLQNYSTLMQILLALGSDKVMKLKDTWRIVEPGDILIYKNLESISSPLKNFMNLRMELNKIKPSKGCVPFLGLYLSDLIFNKEKRSVQGELINFGKFKHTSKIVRSLIQGIQWSTLYKLECDDEVLSKCLYIKALSEEEMNACLVDIL